MGMEGKIPPISLSLVPRPRSIFSRAPAQTRPLFDSLFNSHSLWTEPQGVNWTQGSVFVRTCAYMQPQQSLLLHRRWVARESAADEAKHFLHGER